MVPARWATERDHRRLTMGPAVARVAAALGQPLMPWQRYVADVTGEVDAFGRYAYPLVVVSVPRQSGKTTLGLAQAVHRCLQGPDRRAWWTAQTGMDARDKWREFVDQLMASPLRSMVAGRPRKGNGGESLRFVNGSTFRPHPPTRDALHGKQSDHNDLDEAWAFDETTGADLFQAITPTQATRPGAQTVIWSTRGTRDSTWFHGLINRARAGEPGLALFDWGIPDDADPMNLDVVAAHHPALGLTITPDAVRAARVALGDKPAEFARAYGNRATGAGERVLPAPAWDAAGTLDPLPPGRPAFAAAVSRDGTVGAIVAAVAGPDGVPWCEVIEHRPGRAWLAPRLLEITSRHDAVGVAVDRKGPAAPVADALELAGLTLLPLAGPDYAAACQDVLDRVTATVPTLRHRRHAALDDAADVAGRRTVADGAWVWSRSASTGDICALEAMTLAAWAVARNPVPAEAPAVYFG